MPDLAQTNEGIRLDFSRYPVVLMVAPPKISDEEMADFLVRFAKERDSRTGPFTMVLDVHRSERLSPLQRKMLTDAYGSKEDGQKRCRGVAMVFDSPLLRGVLTAMFWVRKPEYPTAVVATVADGMAWARERLLRSA